MEYPDESEDLSRFALLPDELLVQTCENMDDRTLGRFAKAYKRAADVCSGILNERKGIHKQDKINEIIKKIFTDKDIGYTFSGEFNSVTIDVLSKNRKYFRLTQHIFPPERASQVEWIFPHILYSTSVNVFGGVVRFANVIDDQIPYIINELYSHGYKLSSNTLIRY